MKILIIDDDKTSLSILNAAVEQNGKHSCELYHSAIAALLDMDKIQPDCILTDIHMAGLDGINFIKELVASKRYPHAKFVVMTSLTKGDWKEKAQKAGAHGFLMKPVDPSAIIEQLEAIASV